MSKHIYHKNVVYKLTCTPTNKSYYGITTLGFGKRWKAHLQDFHKGFYNHRPLYEAFLKYNPEHWEKEIIFVGFDEYIIKRVEMLMISNNNTVDHGYNVHRGGVGFDLLKNEFTKFIS